MNFAVAIGRRNGEVMKYHILYNPLAGNGRCESQLDRLISSLSGEQELHKMTEIDSYAAFLSSVRADDVLVIVGGDGTLNRFINDIGDLQIANEVLYFAAGSGNDFLRDVEHGEKPLELPASHRRFPGPRACGGRWERGRCGPEGEHR